MNDTFYWGKFKTIEDYLTYLKNKYFDKYNMLMDKLLILDNTGYILKEKYKENENDHSLNSKVKEKANLYETRHTNKIKSWEPDDFKLEATTIWNFRNRGSWATHNGNYRGNWSPYIPRNVIMRYSKEGDYVLDQFVGSGTTLVETKLLHRKGIGIEINPKVIKIAQNNLNFIKENSFEPKIINGDARNLDFIKEDSIDLICTHPPYSNIIKYSNDIKEDLSLYDIDDFLVQMIMVAEESYRVLKRNKYCALLMGDTRRKKHIIPLGFEVMKIFENSGFVLKEIIIKQQHNCKATGFWYKKSLEYNFLLIAHEYLFVFRKP